MQKNVLFLNSDIGVKNRQVYDERALGELLVDWSNVKMGKMGRLRSFEC